MPGLKPCPKPGCPKLYRPPARACPEHDREREARKPERIRGRQLQERNERLARASPLCVKCAELGIVRAVTQWDHIVPLELGGVDDETNLQGLCDEHHEEKTAAEARERAARGV